MGFYGNISNTSKSTFQFDKIYPNRKFMDEHVNIDSIYPGRFVLVDYEEPVKSYIYPTDGTDVSASTYWIYENHAYTSGFATVDDGNSMQIYDCTSLLTPDDNFIVKKEENTDTKIGKVIKLMPGHRVSNVSSKSMYVTVVNRSPLEHSYEIEVMGGGANAYGYFIDQYIENLVAQNTALTEPEEIKKAIQELTYRSYYQVRMTAKLYERGVYYLKDDQTQEFTITFEDFDEAHKYYDRCIPTERVSTNGEFYHGVKGTDFYRVVYSSTFLGKKTRDLCWASPTDSLSTGIEIGMQYHIPKGHYYETNGPENTEYWTVTSEYEEIVQSKSTGSEETPKTRTIFEWAPIDMTTDSNYLINANIDKEAYKSSRGYDSTVWQKVVQDGVNKYVMVAELNSVVPTLDMAADAPTLIPMVPHFDKNSTNVYYKMHVQPQWGMRIKSADNKLTGPLINKDGEMTEGSKTLMSLDKTLYPSDVSINWTNDFYNAKTGEVSTKIYDFDENTWTDIGQAKSSEIPAAIYFNKDGFNPLRISKSDDLLNYHNDFNEFYGSSIGESGWENADKIKCAPTGISGNMYSSHDGNIAGKTAPDTQELSIMLPSLGNAVSDMWDIVYGGRNTDGRIKDFGNRNLDYAWEDGKDIPERKGLRMVNSENLYDIAESNTLTGCINSIHDLMGMIIDAKSMNLLPPDKLNSEKIYYKDGTYYRQGVEYKYEPLQDSDYTTKPIEAQFIDPNHITSYYKDNRARIPATVQELQEANKTDIFYQRILLNPYHKLALKEWDGSKYWYKNYSPETKKYEYLKRPKYYKEKDYGIVEMEKASLEGVYYPGYYFYLDEEDNLVLDTSKNITKGRTYYTIDHTKALPINATEELTFLPDGAPIRKNRTPFEGFYVPGVYYTLIEEKQDNGALKEKYVLCNEKSIYFGEAKQRHDFYGKGKPIPGSGSGEENSFVEVRDFAPARGSLGEDYKLTEDEFNKALIFGELRFRTDPYSNEYTIINKNSPEAIYNKDYLYEVCTTEYVPNDSREYDFGEPFNLLDLYADNHTYYLKECDADTGEVIRYKRMNYEDIRKVPDEKVDQIIAFGYNYDGENKPGNQGHFHLSFDECLYKGQRTSKSPDDYPIHQQKEFYVPDRYYKKIIDEDFQQTGHTGPKYVSYIIATETEQRISSAEGDSKDEGYFTLIEWNDSDLSQDIYYEPNKYYIKKGDNYKLSTSSAFDPSAEYYNADKYYVKEDSTKTYETGSEWLNCESAIPSQITLSKRVEVPVMIPLEGFARHLNTIHGLILRINQILESDDKNTRNELTVQGSINKLHDIIARFDKFDIKEFVAVDDLGRVRSMPISTDQSESCTQKKGKYINDTSGDVTATDEKQWITVNIDGKPGDSKITIHHNFVPGSAKAAEALNLNNIIDEGSIGSIRNEGKDVLSLDMPVCDELGHINTKKQMSWTLPYGFKHFSATNTSNTEEAEPAINTANAINAVNTQDTLKIAATNKWIKIDTNTDHTLKIGHVLSGNTNANKFYLNPDTDSHDLSENAPTISIPDFKFDMAGHCVGNQKVTFQIPNVFSSITTSNNTVENVKIGTNEELIADTLSDTFDIGSGNKWINISTDAKNEKIIISHTAPGKQTGTTKTGNETPKFGSTFTIPEVKYDTTGHICGIGTHTVTVPKGSLETKESGNVLVDLTFVPEFNEITATKANFADVILEGYSSQTEENSTITVSDSLNLALNKLQNRIIAQENGLSDEITNRGNAINTAIENEVTNRNNAISEAIKEEAAKRDNAITAKINTLSYKDEASNIDSYVTKVTQSNGVIAVERQSVPKIYNKTEIQNIANELTYNYDETNTTMTISDLVQKVKELERKVQELTPPPTV